MKRSLGYSLLEIMVAMTIMGILVAISAPSIQRMQARNYFLSESQKIFDAITDARSNAIAGKMCPPNTAGDPPVESFAWGVKIIPSLADPSAEHNLFVVCYSCPESGCSHLDETLTAPIPPEFIQVSEIITVDGSSYQDEPQGVFIRTSRDGFLTRIWGGVGGSDTPKEQVKIRLTSSMTDQEMGICFDAVAGYPSWMDAWPEESDYTDPCETP